MLLTAPNGVVVDASESAARRLLAAGWTPAAPDGDRPVAKRPVDLAALTVAQLRELCAERGIEAPRRATKAKLIELLTE